jgi:carboxypeptidase family protein
MLHLPAGPVQARDDRHSILRSMAHATATSPPDSTPRRAWSRVTGVARGLSLSRIQSVVATVAGIASVTGAACSLVQYIRPANTGELVAIVQSAGSHRSVSDATVEVLTPENTLVATLTPDAAGRVMQELREGTYLVRVSHPRYAAETRRIQVQPRQTIEVKTTLRAGSSSPVDRAVNHGLGVVRRALGF